jgi:PII-like signaling protein
MGIIWKKKQEEERKNERKGLTPAGLLMEGTTVNRSQRRGMGGASVFEGITGHFA